MVLTLQAFGFIKEAFQIAFSMLSCPNVLVQPVQTINIDLMGSRLSGKTLQVISNAVIEPSYFNYVTNTNIWRLEPQGAEETFQEVLSTYEDKYEQVTNRINCNLSKKKLRIRNNYIRCIGLLSNKKRSTPKIGLYRRGVKKELQVNIFEEANEFEDEKVIELMKQAGGGAKVTINIFIANPWYLGNWYTTRVHKNVGFNELALRTKGQIFKQEYDSVDKVLYLGHISNHRVNTFLEESQHQSLTSLWSVSEQLARVADLGMYGVAEGMIFAPIMYKITAGLKQLHTVKFEGGLDWGVATGENSSATALTLGRRGEGWVSYDDEYYHANSGRIKHMFYKTDDELLREIALKIQAFYDEWKYQIRETYSQTITISLDWAAMVLQSALQNVIYQVLPKFYHDKIILEPCKKIDVPIRIQIMSYMINNNKLYIDKIRCPYTWRFMEEAQWDPIRKVDGQPTMLDKNKDTFDAQWYQFSRSYLDLVDKKLQKYHKYV